MRAEGAPVQEGEILAGKYRVERVLGAGGMGVVVAAQHLLLKERVAIKFLLSAASSGSEVLERFLREARQAARIKSEHVAKVIDVGALEDGTPYMVLEYLAGRDLAAVLAERGPLPLVEAVGYMLQACEGIAEAHAAGIVHRDLKPANFFLAERGAGRTIVKVLDFGVSKQTSLSASQAELSLTKTNAFVGSPLYMSPEQMASAKDVDARADIWSLGVTLYELVTGRPPFNASSITELVAQVLQTVPASPQVVRPDLPTAFVAALSYSLEKTREGRYQNVAQLAAAIAPFGPPHSDLAVERIAAALGPTALAPVSPLARTEVAPAAVVTASSWGVSRAQVRRAPRRGLAVVLGGAALMGTVIVTVAGSYALRMRHAEGAGDARVVSAADALAAPDAPPVMDATPANPVVASPTDAGLLRVASDADVARGDAGDAAPAVHGPKTHTGGFDLGRRE